MALLQLFIVKCKVNSIACLKLTPALTSEVDAEKAVRTLNPESWAKPVLCTRINTRGAGLTHSPGAGGCAGRGRQRSPLAGKAEHRALSCWSTGAEAHLAVILVLAFDIALRQGGGVMWLL